MDLENIQGIDNEAKVGASNISASNDPLQQKNDLNRALSEGAAWAGAQRTIDASDEEMLQLMSRKRQRQHVREETTEQANEREGAFERAANTLLSDTKYSTVDSQRGYHTIGRDDLTEEQRFQGLTDIEAGFRTEEGEQYDPGSGSYRSEGGQYSPESRVKKERYRRTYNPGTRKEKTYTYGDRVKPEEGSPTQYAESESLVGRAAESRSGNIPIGSGNDVAPVSVLKDAAASMDRGMRPGVQGPAAPPHIIEAVKRRLAQSSDPRVQRSEQLARVKQMVAADAANSDPEIRQQNDAKAESEALEIMRSAGVPGAEEYTDVGGLGAVKMKGPAGQITAAPQDPRKMPIAIQDGGMTMEMGDDGRVHAAREYGYVDPRTGQSLADPAFMARQANAPNTAQNANAPQAQNVATWIAGNLPEYRNSSSNFGDYPQTDIALSTTNFAQKVKELSGFGTNNINMDVRSTADLEDMVNAVYAGAERKGQQLFIRDEAGNSTPAAYGDPRGVMHLLKMSNPEQTDLANAVFQMETAGNQHMPSGRVFMGSEVGDRGQARLATVPKNSTIVTGTDSEGKPVRTNIRAALNATNAGPDVTTPVIGAVIDPKTGKQETDAGPAYRTRFKGAGMGTGDEIEGNLHRQAARRVKPGGKLDRERLKQNTTKARIVDERARRAEAAEQERRTTSRVMGKNVSGGPESGQATPLELPTPAADVVVDPRGPMTSGVQAKLAEMRRIPEIRREDMSDSAAAEYEILKASQPRKASTEEPGGALVSLRQPERRSEPQSSYYDGSSKYDVASEMSRREDGIRKRAAANSDIADRLKREILGRAYRGQQERRRRVGIAAAALGGAALAGKGIYDVTRPEEEYLR